MTETALPAESPATPDLVPIAARERVVAIDVLRGVALLGILVMNIQSFAMISAAYMNPSAYGSLEGANGWVWQLCHLLADQKFMTIFSMLFGVGIVVMADRAAAKGRGAASVHYRRMGWLALFGLLHAHLFWFGDILWFYACFGMAAFLFRKLRAAWLLPIAFVMIALPSVLSLTAHWSIQFWPDEALTGNMTQWMPPADAIERELAQYRGGWLEQAGHRTPTAAMFETVMMIFIGPRMLGLMLLGMAIYKLRIVTAEQSRGFYAVLGVVGVAVGVTLTGLGIASNRSHDFEWDHAMFLGSQFNYWGSIATSLGYVGFVMLACRSLPSLWLRPVAAVGQMALTNYFMHTIVCTTIFYGHGFGQFGHFSRVEQIATVGVIWIVQLVVSPIWLHYFRFGPFEWLWRSLTYWKPQPLR